MKPFRWYVGIGPAVRVGLRLHPDRVERALPNYVDIIGPFKTKRAMAWFVEHPGTKLQTVAEFEAAAANNHRAKSSDGRRRAEMFKIWVQIEQQDEAADILENVGEPEDLGEFETLEAAEEAMANLVSIDSETFRDRLLTLAGLSLEEFGLVVYNKPCAELDHIRGYLLGKYAKFKENPLGLVLTLDSKNFQRVFNFLVRGEKPW